MTTYVLGFAFDDDHKNVALIKKKRPDWQAGRLNGIGGHVEKSDKSLHGAMVREFEEETGFYCDAWDLFAVMKFDTAEVYCFYSEVPMRELRTVTDEELAIAPVKHVITGEFHIIPNLRWLIPMAIDFLPDAEDPYHIIQKQP